MQDSVLCLATIQFETVRINSTSYASLNLRQY